MRGEYEAGQSWRTTVSQLLMPMGVRTFEADSGPAAVEVMERNAIHLAVVDTRLPAIWGRMFCELMQRLKEHGQRHILGYSGIKRGGKRREKGDSGVNFGRKARDFGAGCGPKRGRPRGCRGRGKAR